MHSSLRMLRRVSLFLLLLGCGLAVGSGCGGGGGDGDGGGANPPGGGDVSGNWYHPPLYATWQWQLSGSPNTTYDVDLYDLDLFETPASVVDGLHARGIQVLAYFSAGSAENWRPDYAQYAASDLGSNMDGWPGERWVDIRSSGVWNILAARLALAAQKGFDGVEPDNVDGYDNSTGFPLTAADQITFNRRLATEAHRLGLCIALKNAGGIVNDLVNDFDLALNEECHAYAECGLYQPFRAQGKPVLNAEYAASAGAAATLAQTLCPTAASEGLRTLILPLDLDDAFRVACP